MIRIPFSRDYFSDEAKNRLSGINVSLEYDNIESGLFKTATFLCDETFGEETYNKLLSVYGEEIPEPPEEQKVILTALDYLQRGLIHMTIFDDLISLIVKIGNDGITVKKSNDETTLFRYQQDDLGNKLINNSWFWLGKLIELLNKYTEILQEWMMSEKYHDLVS